MRIHHFNRQSFLLKLLIMLPHCVRRVVLSRRLLKTSLALQHSRTHCSASSTEDPDQVRTLLQLCVDRHYVSPGQTNTELFRRGMSCSYGPLGTELRRNLLQQWWYSVTSSTAQVFGINSLSSSSSSNEDTATDGQGQLRVVESEQLKHILEQKKLSKEQLIQRVQMLIHRSPSLRTNFLQGALEQFVPSLELVNRKLPFGLAEAGLCFQPSDGSGCPAEMTQTSLVWFCSPRTSSQWLDHWTRQRLKWWRKFALSPSDFSSNDVPEEELEKAASRGVRIIYSFPWGQETLETLWSRGDTELLQTHKGVHSKLQCRDGRKSVPHVVSITGNMDRGVMAFLSSSLQQLKKEDSKQKLLQRKVLRLHPVLAPVKVALDIGKGATVELRQVCEGLLQEFMEAKISVWPGYLETLPMSMEQLNTKYDEMGVLFTVVISENTLESGLLQVRSRDTTVKEIKHISEIKNFLCRYISAADNI
ncbi:LOW QUALITY PROTEIN: DNA polymerase subunit gamma-2, mitochondrial [Centropristis striata]|uniref:LOW QUALITY PROTEIN: DNA polymerase subunit gamma-2, mitochondrial n=1 Tax=Centropristis striata TaxID=184440 RepID=UPI0027DEBEAE|nr:LOW QUALITY PROTEIN: DNA polymerase subunit gamma-2, mitochondrial [Centropristis striata]